MNDTLFYKIIRPILKVFIYFVYKVEVVGLENIPKKGGVVLAGNHTNDLDSIMLIGVCPRQVHFLAKDSLFKGYTKPFLVGCGAVPVNRSIHDKDALVKAKETLKKDLCIGIFPEGTINRTDDVIMPFKIGAVKMTSDTDSTLVPFIITGKYEKFKKNIRVEFFKGRKISNDLDKENAKLMKEISKGLIKNR